MSKAGILSAGRPSAAKDKAATLASLADEVSLKRINFEISSDLHSRLKMHAANKGKTIRGLLTEHIEDLLKDE